MQTSVHSPSAGHTRRYHDYDYRRGAAMFITFNVEPKEDILGHIEAPGILVPNEWGRMVEQKLLETAAKYPEITLHKYVIMPNHAHLRLYLHPNLPDPLHTLGGFIRSFKMSSRMALTALGHTGPLWQKAYYDLVCVAREMFMSADRYIDNNARKRFLLSSPDRPMRVIEPLMSERLPPDIWWSGVGAVELLSPEQRIASFRLSRSLQSTHYNKVIQCALRAVKAGYAIASTFISPCERTLLQALAETPNARVIKAGHKMLEFVYRPTGFETQLFAENRLLLLSRQSDPDDTRRKGWVDLNENIAAIARAGRVGRAVYARVERPGGPILW